MTLTALAILTGTLVLSIAIIKAIDRFCNQKIVKPPLTPEAEDHRNLNEAN